MAQIAPRRLYGIDGAGVRRRVNPGGRIPASLQLEEPLPVTATRTAEERRIDADKRRRGALRTDRRGIV